MCVVARRADHPGAAAVAGVPRRVQWLDTLRGVHPIEHLRYLAGASGVDDSALVREAAYALSAMPDDPSMLVIVCRRLIERHERSAPLWWLCSSVLVSAEPSATAWELLQRAETDSTLERLTGAVDTDATVAVGRWTESAAVLNAERDDVALTLDPDGADVSVIEAVAASTDQILIDPDDEPLLAADRALLVCRLGTRLAAPVVAEIELRSQDTVVSVAPEVFASVISPSGSNPPKAVKALVPDGPFAPELLRRPVGP